MRVGTRVQVVIPVALKKKFKITRGSKVIFKLDNDRIILEKLKTNSINTFKHISGNGRNINEITNNEYADEIFKRNKL